MDITSIIVNEAHYSEYSCRAVLLLEAQDGQDLNWRQHHGSDAIRVVSGKKVIALTLAEPHRVASGPGPDDDL
jgi:hypothetical protein